MRPQLGVGGAHREEPTAVPDLLSGKLAPAQVAQPALVRPRLLTALTQCVQRAPLTLISGVAGAGKTALAASWREAQPESRHIGWVTLDDYDDDPATFWGYGTEAPARAGVGLVASPRGGGWGPGASGPGGPPAGHLRAPARGGPDGATRPGGPDRRQRRPHHRPAD